MNIIFMGTPGFAVPSLKALLNSRHNIICVVCQPDKPSGRGRKMSIPPVKTVAQQHNVPVEQPSKIRTGDFHKMVNELSPDMICVVAYGKIIPKNILDIPTYGCVNVHASLLPKYRGAAPVNWAIINGEKQTGITTMLMDEGMDTGDILMQRETVINDGDTSVELGEKLSRIGAELLIETIENIVKGDVQPVKQDSDKASYAPIMKKEHGLIDWNKNAVDIRNLIRGTQPWPGAYTKLKGKILKIFKAGTSSDNGKPGEVIMSGDGLLRVSTGTGSVDILELQLEGSRRMDIEDFLRGRNIKKGTVMGD